MLTGILDDLGRVNENRKTAVIINELFILDVDMIHCKKRALQRQLAWARKTSLYFGMDNQWMKEGPEYIVLLLL